MAFSMSYDSKPPAPPKKAEVKVEAAKPARTGRANRPNSPQARAEALFEKRPAAETAPEE